MAPGKNESYDDWVVSSEYRLISNQGNIKDTNDGLLIQSVRYQSGYESNPSWSALSPPDMLFKSFKLFQSLTLIRYFQRGLKY